jgi:hypothetical protein
LPQNITAAKQPLATKLPITASISTDILILSSIPKNNPIL